MTPLHHINPFITALPERAEDWLAALPGPSLIHLHGADPTRVRVLVTLLHGNEPSGLIATHRWLREGRAAVENALATDLVIILANVEAARTPPRHTHRHLPGQRDLNRCFRAPWHDAPGRLAQAILAELVALGPEAVVDLHNTSGRSPAFAVAALDDHRHRTLAGMFCDHMIVTDLRLGALMDCAETLFPTLTVECGGAADANAHALAGDVLRRLGGRPELFAAQPATDTLRVFRNPVRVELAPGASLSFEAGSGADVILGNDIQARNFHISQPGDVLAWLRDTREIRLTARDHRGRPVLNELFAIRDNVLTPRVPLRLFMATDRADIAASDCLFYVASGEEGLTGSQA